MKIGVISDTHGLLRPEVVAALQGSDVILHGGDINRQEILDELQKIAPVHVVRCNNDKEWAEDIPMYLDLRLDSLRIYMTHKKKDLPQDLSAYDLVIYGHSHKYEESMQGATHFLNPGSCGPRRFHQAITMAVVETRDGKIYITRIDIPHPEPKERTKAAPVDLKRQIEIVMRETERGRNVADTAARHRFDPDVVEQIARLYVTHPGVTADEIMTKMGI